ncbi:MAG: hypothetical protein EZS28_000822 [Streblomastix strix]|uniref:Uncharacterized protein n=1 Tax=Streblomastix strix TaxID=222440 RepID=A0A5J4X8Y0_9EUKA|nr:MAG: hypothetical protein EZS28_000822 [Streblomastix strix]
MSTIRGHGEIVIEALNQGWKKEFSWIHSPIPLLSAFPKSIREQQIRSLILSPLWPCQIWHTELLNQNVQSLIPDLSSEVMDAGTSLPQKNLKPPPYNISCFMIDRRPEKEEDMQERF